MHRPAKRIKILLVFAPIVIVRKQECAYLVIDDDLLYFRGEPALHRGVDIATEFGELREVRVELATCQRTAF